MADQIFEKQLLARASHVEDVLKRFLPAEEGYAKRVIEAMNYSLMAGGKRLRPVMMLESYRLFSGNGDESVVEPFMAAIEMIHTYSLVHDDLPCMDNDEYRRGRKTTHAVYGAGMATLAGDGLLNFAFETAVKGALTGKELPSYDGENKNRFLSALEVLATKAGIYGMVGGQCADIMAENADLGSADMKDVLAYIDENKTGALIESSLMVGAILGGADKKQVDMMERAGSNVGIAFQIQDDILDIVGNQEELGKPIGSDEKNNKTTYVSLYGMEEARNKVKQMSDEASAILSELGFGDSFLDGLFEYLIYRNK
ncbi:polyprenyl synthetase family protein [Butyrivibrio sp. DSM 10294]|uniref:polyprenyl synthetase family protein n=1 Tax=Butyrivibrio sp. DSM 10294 TaxID=2972457 RepID=UPI00234FAB6A|nr:farnesyl diphosphate synthase [Butyrivibrio sp. DSM 10294]MDC7293789.1 polyprenyl synthetase family protein [Butyrivibrio sp. DSM 10294]